MGLWTAALTVDTFRTSREKCTTYLHSVILKLVATRRFHTNEVAERVDLWQISDVHLHVAALTGPIQPFHVHVQRPGTQQDK